MDSRKRLVLLGALAMGAVGGIAPQHALAQATAEEQACIRALQANTIPALEEFLRDYPPSSGNEPSACQAFALEALQQFGPATTADTESTDRVTGALYGG